jgi:hypothetical protein
MFRIPVLGVRFFGPKKLEIFQFWWGLLMIGSKEMAIHHFDTESVSPLNSLISQSMPVVMEKLQRNFTNIFPTIYSNQGVLLSGLNFEKCKFFHLEQ